MVLRLFLILVLNCLAFSAIAETVRIGLRVHSGVEKGMAQWQPTADYLTAKIPGYEFEMVPYVSIEELNRQAGQGEFDFVLTNPSSYVDLEINHRATRMLTLVNKRQGGAYTQFGSVIFVRADSEISDFSGLKGKRFMAVSESAFGGWRVSWRELQDDGIDPYTYFSELLFSGGVQEEVVYAVRDGRADAGSVRTDMLERMAAVGEIDLNEIRVIHPVTTEGFPFLHSSRLYPEWPFAKFEHTSSELAKKVDIALLLMPETDNAAQLGNYVGWTAPLDYSHVHALLKELNVGAYSNYDDISLLDVVEKYWYLIVIVVIFMMIIGVALFYMVRANRHLHQVQFDLKKTNTDLVRRINDLDCIYKLTALTGNEDVTVDFKLKKIVNLIASTWHQSQNAHVRIVYNQRKYESVGFNETRCDIAKDLIIDGECVGRIDIYSGDSLKDSCDALFYVGEEELLSEIIARLISFLKRDQSGKKLREAHDLLELRVKERTLELEQAVAEVKAANEAKSGFLFRMTHELRTPMNAILGFSQLMDAEYDEKLSDENKANLHEIITAGNKLLALINDIIELQELESNAYYLDVQEVSYSSCVDGMLGTLQPLLSKQGVVLENQLKESDDSYVMADPIRLKQVIINLVSNAAKFNRPGGSITLRCQRKDNACRLVVEDTGVGIDFSFQEKLFEPFVRINRIPRVEGSGIGLSVCKHLIEAMGGSIGVNSELGVGSEFWVELKCAY